VSGCGLACYIMNGYAGAWQPMYAYKRLRQCMVTRGNLWHAAPVHGTPCHLMEAWFSAWNAMVPHGTLCHCTGAWATSRHAAKRRRHELPCTTMPRHGRGSGMPWVARWHGTGTPWHGVACLGMSRRQFLECIKSLGKISLKQTR
jgi:hypothetical protein